jgi:hypothetical protein
LSSTKVCPRATCCPLVNSTRVISSVLLEVMVTDWRALACPRTSRRSSKARSSGSVTLTTAARPPRPPGPPPPPPPAGPALRLGLVGRQEHLPQARGRYQQQKSHGDDEKGVTTQQGGSRRG